MENNTQATKQECADCKLIFMLTFASLLALFIVTYLMRGPEAILTNMSASSTSSVGSSTSNK